MLMMTSTLILENYSLWEDKISSIYYADVALGWISFAWVLMVEVSSNYGWSIQETNFILRGFK